MAFVFRGDGLAKLQGFELPTRFSAVFQDSGLASLVWDFLLSSEAIG